MSILLIKLTSMGDAIHVLPALTDAMQAIPDIQFDWVIDQGLQNIASWHPAVEHVFTTNHRMWRRHVIASIRPIYQTIQAIRTQKYDLVIDAQGNFKSALLAFFARGVKAGFDRHSARESISHLAYQKKIAASWSLHAIERLRILFAEALGYPLPNTPPNFGLNTAKFLKPKCDLPTQYLLFIPNAAWKTKLWPEEHWKKLLQMTEMPVFIPWGSQEEKSRAERLAIAPHVHVLPKLTLNEIAYVIQHAKSCVSVDTGLSHLASALEVPCVTLYGPASPDAIGTMGPTQKQIQSPRTCAPCSKKTCCCLKEITPEDVWQALGIYNTPYGHCITK